MEQLKRLIKETHRRSLWQVLAIYVGASWVVFEIVQTVTEGLPSWFPPFAALLLLIGLPIVLATAFVQEGLSPTRRQDPTLVPASETESADGPDGGPRVRRLFTWRNAITGGVLALALWGLVAAGWLVLGEREEKSELERKSVAVLPFENIGAAEENQAFTDGIHDVIIAHLSKIRDLKVISHTSVMEYRDELPNLRTVADQLGVTHVLEGSVFRDGDRVRNAIMTVRSPWIRRTRQPMITNSFSCYGR